MNKLSLFGMILLLIGLILLSSFIYAVGECSTTPSHYSFYDQANGVVSDSWAGTGATVSYTTGWGVGDNTALKTVSESLSKYSNSTTANSLVLWWNVTYTPVTDISRWVTFSTTTSTANAYCGIGLRGASSQIKYGVNIENFSNYPIESNKIFQTLIQLNGTACNYYARNTSSQNWNFIGSTTTANTAITRIILSNEGIPSPSEIVLMDNIGFFNYTNAGECLSGGAVFVPPTPDNNAHNNTQAIINLTCSQGTDLRLWFDNETNPVNLVASRTGLTYLNWTTNLTTPGTYYYKGSCDNAVTNSTTRTWFYDSNPPTITLNPTNYFNTSNQTASKTNEDLRFNITFEDNSDLFGFEINVSHNGITYFNFSNVSLAGRTSYIWNYNTSMYYWPNGRYEVEITASDSHTAQSINDYQVTTKLNDLKFITIEKNEIRIIPEQEAMPTASKTTDRYEFGFSYTDKKIGTKSYLVSCNNELKYLPNSKYNAHFVCWNPSEKKGNWIDFEGVEGKPTVIKITDNQYRVTFDNLGDTLFKSIGGLNYNTEYHSFELERYFIDNCSVYNYTILNFSYYNQLSDLLIDVKTTINLLFSGATDINFTGILPNQTSHSFCVHPSGNDFNVTGQIKLEKDNYVTQFFDITKPIEAFPITQKKFYMILLNESSTVVFNWLFSDYSPVSGTMLVYECIGDGIKNLVQSVPITNAEASANLELLNTLYSYEVISNGVTYQDTSDYSKCHIETQTSRSYIITKGTEVSPIIGIYSIDCNLTKTGNNTVLMSWGNNPESSSQITGCIFANRMTGISTTLIYTFCSNDSGIERTIPESGYSYSVYGKIYQNGYSIQCKDAIEFNYDKNPARSFGLAGVLAVFFLIAGLILLWSNESPEWYAIGGILGIILAWVLGLLAFGWVPISSLIAFVVIIIIVGRYNRKNT